MELFKISDFFISLIKNSLNICPFKSLIYTKHHDVIQKVINLVHKLIIVVVLSSNNCFCSFLAYFLADFVYALVKKIAGIRLTEKTSHAYKSVSVAYRNPKTGKDVTATAKNPNCVKGDTLKLSVRAENKQQALLQAKAALAKGNYTIEGSLSMPGNPYLVAGLNAELKDLGYFSGKYHITEAHHIIDKTSGYATSLEVKSC